jgi:hypothetical protein
MLSSQLVCKRCEFLGCFCPKFRQIFGTANFEPCLAYLCLGDMVQGLVDVVVKWALDVTYTHVHLQLPETFINQPLIIVVAGLRDSHSPKQVLQGNTKRKTIDASWSQKKNAVLSRIRLEV